MSRAVVPLITAALLFASAHEARAGVRVAVSYFANRSGDKKLEPLKRGLADMLITDLAAASDITVVERARLQKLVDELKLQRNPYFDKRSAGKLGKGLSAAYLITGAYLLSGGKLSLEARVVDVETSKVVLGVRQQGESGALFALQTGLAKKLIKGLGAKLSLIGRKKIGARATKSLKAFGHYARSLAARDEGDKRAERVALKRALAADPGFVAVKQRLQKLERRVARLERSGGLIITPTTASEHLHNAKLHRAAGRAAKARQSALAALGLAPRMAEAWKILGELSGKIPVGALRKLGLTAPQRAAARAFLAKKGARLLSSRLPPLGELKRQARRLKKPLDVAFAAALSFYREDQPPPLASASAIARLYRATLALRRGPARKALRGEVADADALFRRVDQVFRRSFAGEVKRRVHAYGMAAVITNRSKHRKPWPFWSLSINLYDWVKGPISVRLLRQKDHPHWREKAVAPGYLKFIQNRLYRRQPPAVKRALGDPKKLVLRAQWPVRVGRSQPSLRVAPFGKAVTFSADALRCRSYAGSMTGSRCQILIYISKGNLLPGCYAVELSYQHQGQKVRLSYPVVWAHELKLTARPPYGRRMRMGWIRKLVHRVTPGNRSGYDRLSELAGAGRYALLINVEPVYAENHGLGFHSRRAAWMQRKVPYPVKSLHYDIDGKLLGGIDKLPPNDDFKAWQRYRDRILRRGRKRPAMPYKDQFLPLPELKPGRHLICIATRHHNGAKSAEPDCRHFNVN